MWSNQLPWKDMFSWSYISNYFNVVINWDIDILTKQKYLIVRKSADKLYSLSENYQKCIVGVIDG